MNRFMIAGTHSGSGKTTLTCAILQAFCQRNLNVHAFKCGCDYIDPMFHEKIIGIKSHNLDSFFCDKNLLCYLLQKHAGDINIIEGVMGFYDGEKTSAHAVSELTDTPVILVIDCKGMSNSMGAVMQGFLNYQPNRIAGFIFNRLPEKLTSLAKQFCENLNTEYFGFFPMQKQVIPSRHLGLVTADEITDIQKLIQMLGEQAEKTILLDKLMNFDRPVPAFQRPEIKKSAQKPVIAIAKDEAFCFMYPDNLELLEQSGCELHFFSPLHDKKFPDADGLILCGGYPELYAEQLSKNQIMQNQIREHICSDMPVIAECGGFLYLHKLLKDAEKQVFPMTGIFQETAFPTARLQRFGYVTLTAQKDNLLCRKNQQLKAHEFHYWDSTSPGADFMAAKTDGRTWPCIHADKTIYAGFPHLYFYASLCALENFVNACETYQKGKEHA